MTYVSWATVYEGETDRTYYDVLLPRVMEAIIQAEGIRNSEIPEMPAVSFPRRKMDGLTDEICQAKDAFHLLFVHADTGGRNLEAGIDARSCALCRALRDRCDWPQQRCIVISPRHETEAWVLADPAAVTAALGFSGPHASIGLPNGALEAERVGDPKAVLEGAVKSVRGPRRQFAAHQIFAAVAQRQSLDKLRLARSFIAFESNLRGALADLGCVAPRP